MGNGSHLTAISRRTLSKPTQYLVRHGLLQGRLLDYGCGRGFDCDYLQCEGYDPHYRPQSPTGAYDTIFCNYVLNVLPTVEERQSVIDGIQTLLSKVGRAYIAVRADRKALNGWTSKGTYQTWVDLKLPILVDSANFRTYILDAQNSCRILG